MEISISNLQKRFKNIIAVDIESFHIPSGQIFGLVGNNGAGKTTLFRLALDLVKADQGVFEIDNKSVTLGEEWKNHVGAYIDNSFLIDYLSVEEYFSFLSRIYGFGKKTLTDRITFFDKLMSDNFLDKKKLIRDYSAGNKIKIGIMAALIHKPGIVILDEPFNFLDPSSQSVMKHFLKEYNRQTGATIILSSHNLNHTVEISDRIALMEKGRLIKDIDNSNNSAESELLSYFNVD